MKRVVLPNLIIIMITLVIPKANTQTTLGLVFTGVNASASPVTLGEIISILSAYSLNYTKYAYAESDPYLSIKTCGQGTITVSLSQSTCTYCSPGTYQSIPAQSTCQTCSAGYYSISNQTGAISSSICTSCQQGTYALAGDPYCSTCGVNTWSDVAYGTCQNCPGNSSSVAGSYLFGCICAPGFQYNRLMFPFTCSQCTGGYWSPGDSEICIACTAGSASPFLGAVSADACSTCGAGYFAPTGASTCQLCPAGTIAANAGASSCTPCQPGYYTPAGGTQCIACGNGTYNTATGAGDSSMCLGCAGGTYATGAARTVCATCAAGSYTPTGGSQCLLCGVGTFAEPSSTSCLGCPTNSVGPGGTDATGCVCTAGHYPFYRTRGVGGVESVVGQTLKQHVFTADGFLSLYLQTVISLYCGSTLWGAFVWSKGIQVITIGSCGQITISYSISGAFYAGDSPTYFQCTGCSPGYISNYGDTSCQPCGAGTEQPMSAMSTCTTCTPGSVNPTPGTPSCTQCAGGTIQFLNSLTCTTCPIGSYSTTGTTVCLACPENTYSQGGASQCTPCPYYSVSLGGGGLSQCVCQAGYVAAYDPSFVCVTCPNGMYSLINASACVNCGPGSYSVSPAGQCVGCARGSYQPSSGLGSCLPCPIGTLSDPGAPECSACPAPMYCIGGGQYSPCPLGTFSNLLGLQSADQCPICPVNSFCQTSGEIEPCPAHTTSSAGSTSKLNCLCNPGYVCTYKKAVRVNVTLPLTQAQFALIRDQFLQSVANAAGVDVSQVSIIGLTLLNPNRRLLDESGDMLIVHVHVEGSDHLHALAPRLRRITGIHRVRTRTRTAHRIHIWKV